MKTVVAPAQAKPDQFTAAGFARTTRDQAKNVAETARQKAYDDYWNEELDRLKAKFPDGRVYLYLTASDKLALIRGGHLITDLFGLSSSYQECLVAAKAGISEVHGAENWALVEASLRGFGEAEPELADNFPVEVGGLHYWFVCWPFSDLETWIRDKVAYWARCPM